MVSSWAPQPFLPTSTKERGWPYRAWAIPKAAASVSMFFLGCKTTTASRKGAETLYFSITKRRASAGAIGWKKRGETALGIATTRSGGHRYRRNMSWRDVSETVITFAARLIERATPMLSRRRCFHGNHSGWRRKEISCTVVMTGQEQPKGTVYCTWSRSQRSFRAMAGSVKRLHSRSLRAGITRKTRFEAEGSTSLGKGRWLYT